MKVKHGKEIIVAILFIVSAVLLYFGMNFLKGVNVFKSTKDYVATFENANGLVEQADVFIKGYKVGQVSKITYDFTKPQPFVVEFTTRKDIKLPEGTVVVMMADGLLGGEALDLRFPEEQTTAYLHSGDTIPSQIEAGLIDGIIGGLTSRIDPIMINLDSIVAALKNNLTDEQIASIVKSLDGTLANADDITKRVDIMLATSIPQMMDSIQLVVNDFHEISANLSEVDFQATILKLDTTINGVNEVVGKCNSTDGTIGMLLNDNDLYINLNNTVSSADSLVVDLKAHPKRYVHFSLFGKKEK